MLEFGAPARMNENVDNDNASPYDNNKDQCCSEGKKNREPRTETETENWDREPRPRPRAKKTENSETETEIDFFYVF